MRDERLDGLRLLTHTNETNHRQQFIPLPCPLHKKHPIASSSNNETILRANRHSVYPLSIFSGLAVYKCLQMSMSCLHLFRTNIAQKGVLFDKNRQNRHNFIKIHRKGKGVLRRPPSLFSNQFLRVSVCLFCL